MGSRPGIGLVVLLASVLVAMPAPSSVDAANVVNGDFESGTLAGWQVHRVTQAGDWFAYRGTDAPIGHKRKPKPADPVQAPPQGAYAATTDQANPDTLILYQDIALEPGRSHRLSLLAYYDSYEPIAVPVPDTLSVDEEALMKPNGELRRNQQYRIDVIKPTAPLDSVNPDDVLRTLLATRPGDPQRLAPTKLTANLSAFAGQTVRLRIANAAHEEVFNAGVDAISFAGTGPRGQSVHGARRFSIAGVKANRRNGTATLRVRVSSPGLLRAKGGSARAGASRMVRAGRARKPIEPVTVPVAQARTVTLHLRPTLPVRAVLRQKHKLRVKVALTYMPTDGPPEAATVPVVFNLEPRPHRRR